MSRGEPGKPLTLVVVQPTSLCNLNCTYCYVPDRKNATLITDSMLDAIFRTTVGSPLSKTRRFEFLWHAGEPLTAGIHFFQRAMDICEAYKTAGETVVHSIQTNGVLINQEWIDFFKKYNFKIGVSIDGPAFLHNANRKTWGGKDTLDKALRGYRMCLENELNPAVLAVLTKDSLDYPDEILEFFVENEIWSFGFNAEEVENMHQVTSYGSTNADPPQWLRDKYREFFSRLFDLWWPLRYAISIREFRDITYGIRRKYKLPDHFRRPDETAELGIVTIQKNGDITTFSPELAGAKSTEYRDFVVGNILQIQSLEEIKHHPIYKKLHSEIDNGRRLCAQSCLYFDFCGSAFVSNRYFETGRFDGAESTSCILQRKIVASVVIEKLQHMSTQILNQNQIPIAEGVSQG
jgi:uncharacterized protein